MYIIPTGTEHGIDNVLIITDGDYNTPKVSAVIRINDNAESILSDVREIIYDYSERTSLVPSEFAQSLKQEGILELYRSVDFQSFEEYPTRRKGSGSKTYRRSYTFSDGEGTGGLSDETGSYVDNGEYSNDSRPQNILDNEKSNFALRAPVEETKDLIAVHSYTIRHFRPMMEPKRKYFIPFCA
ncbi:MAG: hypothetical protein U0M70_06605 [Eubacteriales bacterium]